MKKTVLALLMVPALSGMAYADQQSVTLGWAHANVETAGGINGINLKYRYEWDSPISVMGSFSWMKGSNDQQYLLTQDIIKNKVDINTWSLMAGPAWRINQYVSAYGLLGFNVSNVKASSNWINYLGTNPMTGKKEYEDMGTTSASQTRTNFAYGAGIQINPTENLVVDVGYEGTQIKTEYRSFSVNGFNVGVGYRF